MGAVESDLVQPRWERRNKIWMEGIQSRELCRRVTSVGHSPKDNQITIPSSLLPYMESARISPCMSNSPRYRRGLSTVLNTRYCLFHPQTGGQCGGNMYCRMVLIMIIYRDTWFGHTGWTDVYVVRDRWFPLVLSKVARAGTIYRKPAHTIPSSG